MNQLVVDFCECLLALAVNVADICPNSLIGNNIKHVKTIITTPKNKVELIMLFIEQVMPFKVEIKKREESFFMDKKCDGLDSDMMSKIFEFRSIWASLKPENKKIFIDTMIILCEVAEEFEKTDECEELKRIRLLEKNAREKNNAK